MLTLAVNLFRSLWSSTPRQRLQKTREAIARQSTNFDAQLLNVERTEAREELMQRQRIAGKNILPKGVAFNHHGNPSFPIHILPARSLQFIKRDTELLRIHHSLKEQDQSSRECQPLPAYCTLLGIGGVGKTETALEYVHTHASAYDLIAWIPAEHSSKRVHAYCQLAKRLGLMREDKVGDESDIEQTREWLETTGMPNAHAIVALLTLLNSETVATCSRQCGRLQGYSELPPCGDSCTRRNPSHYSNCRNGPRSSPQDYYRAIQ